MKDVTADVFDLIRQAPTTIMYYYRDIESCFEERYGKQWVKEHTDTISRLACACATDLDTSCRCSCIQELRDVFRDRLDNLSSCVETLSRYVEDLADSVDYFTQSETLEQSQK